MLKQYVSIDGESCKKPSPTAFLPMQVGSQGLRADPDLQERVDRAAATLGIFPPILLPGAAALVLPVSLPLKRDRQRRAALPFAVEPHLGEPIDQVTVALGPQVSDQNWVCVAVNTARLAALSEGSPNSGVCFPDTLAVPLPAHSGAWAIWCGRDTLHIRRADGTGLALARDTFCDAWRAFGSPPLEILHGTPPPGVKGQHVAPAAIDPEIFKTDLHVGKSRGGLHRLQGLARFAASVAIMAGLAHVALLRVDAAFLESSVSDRTEGLQQQLESHGIPLPANGPAHRIEAAILDAASVGAVQDPFLAQLALSLDALPQGGTVTLRDLRFYAATGSLTVLLTAAGLQDLQSAESALTDAGLTVTSGAATRSDAGAEMQLIIRSGA